MFITSDDHQVFQVGRVKSKAGTDVETERVYKPESSAVTNWEKWPRALKDVTSADGTVTEHAVAPAQEGPMGPFGLVCLIKGAGNEYVWRFPLDGIPYVANDDRFIWDLYYREDTTPIITGSSVEHAEWFVDFRHTDKNDGVLLVVPPNDYTVDNVIEDSAPGTVKYFGLPEDTRITFRLRAEDNVDGPIKKFVSKGEGKNYAISLEGADDTFNLDNWDTLTMYQEEEAAELKEYAFYQVYHYPSPEGDEGIKVMTLKVWDSAGNMRAIKIPLKVINTNVRVYALENLRKYDVKPLPPEGK
jgi:hypothetical protein